MIFFPAFDWAISPTHPEREERLLYTRDQLFEEGIMDMPGVAEYHPRLATPGRQPPGGRDVAAEALALVLGQHRDPELAGVDEVREGEVDQPVVFPERHRRLRPVHRRGASRFPSPPARTMAKTRELRMGAAYSFRARRVTAARRRP